MKNRKLEAKDLMIGDWVKVLPISKKVTVHYSKVGALTRNVDNSISIEGGYFPSWTGWSVSEEDIKPIPLIPETLEKNGFERKFTCNCYISVVNGKTISVDVPESLKSQSCTLWIGDCFGGTILHIQISYVHELQRALRCCRLWDLADNFKV